MNSPDRSIVISILAIIICSFTTSHIFGQYTSIPDSNFEQRLIDLGIDSTGIHDGQILTSDAESVTSLNLQRQNIQDLTGIEAFINLTELNCNRNNLSTLDISSLENLNKLYCAYNVLTELHLGSGNNLGLLDCSRNNISTIDLSGQLDLGELNCRSNELNELDLSNLTWLHTLDCSQNSISELNLMDNEFLYILTVWGTNVQQLDLTQCQNIFALDCDYPLLFIDLRGINLDLLSYLSVPTVECVAVDDPEYFYSNFSANNPNTMFSTICNSCENTNLWKGGTGYWKDPNNWSFERVPNACDDVNISIPGSEVIIRSGRIVDVATLAMHNGTKLKVENYASLTIDCSESKYKRSGVYLQTYSELENHGTLNIHCAYSKGINLQSSTFLNYGIINIDSFGITQPEPSGIRVSSKSHFDNRGSLTIRNAVDKTDNNGITVHSGGEFINRFNRTISLYNIRGPGADGIDNMGEFLNNGTINIDSVVSGYGFMNWIETGIVENNGTINVSRTPMGMGIKNDSSAIWTGNGSTNGSSFADRGIMSPGASAGQINITGDHLKDSTSIDTFEILGRAGAGQSAGHDLLAVSGDLNLSGELVIKGNASFSPGHLEPFTLMTYSGNLTGAYNTLSYSGFPPGSIDYSTPGQVILRAPACDHPDFAVLMTLYDSLGGSNWTSKEGWLNGANATSCDPCQDSWYGVTCEDGRVVDLDLSGNNLAGSIPSSINSLVQLQKLNLSENMIFGPIPDLSLLTDLSLLDLHSNQITGMLPGSVFYCPNMTDVNLSGNDLDSLESMDQLPFASTLKNIDLSNNPDLSAQLPIQWGALPSLESLLITNCAFADCYPTSYMQICDIQTEFDGNNLPDFSLFCYADGSGACNDCQDGDLHFDQSPLPDGTFIKLSGNLFSAGTIDSSSTVIFHSNSTVQLNPGFQIEENALFLADIKPCDNN